MGRSQSSYTKYAIGAGGGEFAVVTIAPTDALGGLYVVIDSILIANQPGATPGEIFVYGNAGSYPSGVVERLDVLDSNFVAAKDQFMHLTWPSGFPVVDDNGGLYASRTVVVTSSGSDAENRVLVNYHLQKTLH